MIRPLRTLAFLLIVVTIPVVGRAADIFDLVRDHYADSNGVRIHYVTRGQGPLVVMIHGFPDFWYGWRDQIGVLARHHQVAALDLRGYNLSDKPAGVEQYGLGLLVADVAAVIHDLGRDRATIVGHDWGGAIAWTFAMDEPAMTRRLVVMNCPHPAIFTQHLRASGRQLARSWYMFFFQIPWLPESLLGLGRARAIAAAIRRSSVRQDSLTAEDLERFRDAASQPGALRSAINYYRAAFRSPEAQGLRPEWLRRFLYGDRPVAGVRERLEDWPKITAPTLFIWGENDVALDKELTLGMEPLVAAPFEIKYIPLCGHWVQQEQPGVVNGFLLDFLNDLAPGGGNA